MRVPVPADTLTEGVWIEMDRMDGEGPTALLISSVLLQEANEETGTDEVVVLRFDGDAPNRFASFEPTSSVVAFTGEPEPPE